MSLKNRVLDQMEKLGISKAELVRLSGVKKSTVYTFFQRDTELQLETLRPIASALKVSLEYLIYGEEKQTTEKKPYIYRLFNALSDSEQADVIGIIEAMIIRKTQSLDIEKYIQEQEISSKY